MYCNLYTILLNKLRIHHEVKTSSGNNIVFVCFCLSLVFNEWFAMITQQLQLATLKLQFLLIRSTIMALFKIVLDLFIFLNFLSLPRKILFDSSHNS